MRRVRQQRAGVVRPLARHSVTVRVLEFANGVYSWLLTRALEARGAKLRALRRDMKAHSDVLARVRVR